MDSLPAELRALDQWVLHRAKVPYQVNGQNAKTTNPGHWAPFDGVDLQLLHGDFDGIGFVFSKDDPYCGIDLDKCVNKETGVIDTWAQKIVNAFGSSYIEYSYSGTGLHIITRAKLPGGKGCRKGQIEIYDQGRYFTMTGNTLRAPEDPIPNQQKDVDDLLTHYFNGTQEAPASSMEPLSGKALQETELKKVIERAKTAKNGDKFSRLFDGKTSDYGGDESRADAALCSMLGFWFEGNELAIEQAFSKSGLVRDKWRYRSDYRIRTIRKACHLKDTGLDFDDLTTGADRIIKIRTLGEFMAEEIPIPSPIIDGIINHGETIILSGPMKLGKSMLAANLSLHAATGRDWHLHLVPAPVRTLYLQREIGEPWLQERFRKMMGPAAWCSDVTRANLLVPKPVMLKLDDDQHISELIEQIRQQAIALVIIDPLFCMISGNENDTQDMAKVMDNVNRIKLETGCSVLIIHHHGKGDTSGRWGGDKQRGSSVIGGASDGNITLERLDPTMMENNGIAGDVDRCALLSFQMRNTENNETLILELGQDLWWQIVQSGPIDHSRKPTPAPIRNFLPADGSPVKRSDLVDELFIQGWGKSAAGQEINRLIREGVLTQHKRSDVPNGHNIALCMEVGSL